MITSQLLLLGPPALEAGGAVLRMDKKPLLLLAWLALADGPVSRTSLAELLWPDSNQPGVNLRKGLAEIRLALGGGALIDTAASRSLALGPGLLVDARTFDQAMAAVTAHGHGDGVPCSSCATRLEGTLGLWRGDFMAGFRLPGTADLDDWLNLHAQRLALRRIWALDQLALYAAAREDWESALSHGRQRLGQNPIDEVGHRRLARLLAWSGQRAAALRQLEACAAMLADELGLRPSTATEALELDIRADSLAPPPTSTDSARQGGTRADPREGVAAVHGRGRPVLARIAVLEAYPDATAADRQVDGRQRRTVRQSAPPLPARLRAAQGRLLATVLHPEAQAAVSEDDLSDLAALAPLDLTTYRLGRVAAWSLPRYRLNRNFLSLTVLLDRGQEIRDRWRPRAERYEDLRALLAAVADPVLVLLGRPGAGKSTLLRRLEFDVAVDALRGTTDAVPFLVPLNAYRPATDAADGPDPGRWLAERWRQRNAMLPALEDLLADGRMVLMLDGLNEMPYHDDAGQFALTRLWRSWLQDLTERWPGNRVLLSCRGLDYSAPLSTPRLPVPQVQLEPLSDVQIRELVACLAGDAADDVLARLGQAPDWNLLRTPYVLGLLVDQLMAGETGEPDWVALQVAVLRRSLRRELERGNPCLAFAEGEHAAGIFTARDSRRVLQTRHWPDAYALPDDGRLFDRLSRLAWRMQAGRPGGEAAQVRIRHADALAALDDPAADVILRAGHALGLIEDDPERDELAFNHQLLQEHFAARRLALVADLSPLAVAWRAADLRPGLEATVAGLGRADPLPPPPGSGWEETALQAAALSRDPAAFIAGLQAVDLVLAGRCASRWLGRWSPGAQYPARDAALSAALGERDEAAALIDQLRWALVERTRDRNADLRARIAAGLALGELGDPRLLCWRGPEGDCLLPPMVAVAGGRYRLGGMEGAGEVTLAAFSIAALEVTNAEWACFMAAGCYDYPLWWDTPAARNWQQGLTTADDTRAQARQATARFRADPAELERLFAEGHMPADWHAIFRERIALDPPALEAHLAQMYPGGRLTAPRFWGDPSFNNPAQPVVGISWFEARAYTLWLAAQTGKPFRLPSELEWEAAARHGTGAARLAGGGILEQTVNTSEVHVWRPSPVGVFPDGDTPEGITDLCGNVWEWTSSVFGRDRDHPDFKVPRLPGTEGAAEAPAAPPDLRRVARGGAWDSPRTVALPWVRDAVLPGGRDAGYGMRLGWG